MDNHNSGWNPPRAQYPWKQGDELFADELNAAIAAASSGVAAGGPFLPLTGGTISPGPLNIVNGNTLTLRTSPTQAQISYNAPNLLYEASTFTGTISGNTLTITSAVQGIIKVGHAIYWPANLIPGDTIVAGSGTTWTLANSWTVASALFSTNNKESVTQFRALPAVSGLIPTGGINNQAITGIQLGASLDDLKLTSQLGMDFLDISSLKTGPDYDGTRYAMRAEIRVSDPCVLTSKQHVVGGFYITARGQGDTGGTAGPGNGVGNVFGGILTATNGSASGYWASVIGQEIDIGVVAPAQPESVIGMQIVHQAGHTQQGIYADIGFGLGDQGTVAKGWRVGVSVGGPNSQWPIDPNGIIWRSSYAPSTPWANGIPGAQAAGGFDLAQVDFTGMSDVGGGFAFRVDGAKIIPALGNPGGTFEAGAGEFSGTSTGAKIDTTFSQMTGTPAVVAGGSLWNVGDTLNDQWGNHLQVATLSGTAIATVTVLRRGWQKTPPTNPVAFTINAVGPGATLRLGTGATFNLTWTLNNTLALQPSGGQVQSMTTDWLSPLSGWHGAVSHAYVLTPTGIGGTALTGGALSTAGVNGLAIGITGLGFNQSAGSVNGAWGGYFEARQYPGATSYTQGIEVDVCNVSATDAVQGSPYINFPQPTSIGINLQSGGQVHSESPPLVAKAASVGLWVGDNDARFQTGIIFKNTALVGTDGTGSGTAQAVAMATGHQIQWYMPSGALGPSIGSQQTTGTPGQIVFENSRVHIVGGLFAPGGVTVGPPTILGGTSYAVSATDYTLIIAGSGTFTLTLPTAVGNVGRVLILKNAVAFTVNSASANVFPFTGGAAGAPIMPATAGKFCWLQCDGTNWQLMMAN